MKHLISKQIVVPVDGSDKALKPLDYLDLLYGPKHDLDVILLNILPTLPQLFQDDKDFRQKLAIVEKNNITMAERILSEARNFLIQKGFHEDRVRAEYQKKGVGAARDISAFASKNHSDAILCSTRGRTRLENFFMGCVPSNLIEYCQNRPVWIMNNSIKNGDVLIAIDSSDNAMNAVEHAGRMLLGTEHKIIIFHTKRNLRRFIPLETFENTPEIEIMWQEMAAKVIAPYMLKAKDKLIALGISESQISTSVIDGTRAPADDILNATRKNNCGTLILGRRGASGNMDYCMGRITRKITQNIIDFAVWIV